MLPIAAQQLPIVIETLQKIEDSILFYEREAKDSIDPLCGLLLNDIADLKRIQLFALKRILFDRGIDTISLKCDAQRENVFFTVELSEKNLEDIYNFASKQSLHDLKNYTFLSIRNGALKPIFKALFELEEEFLVFVQSEYLHKLADSAGRINTPRPVEETLLTSA